LPPKIYHYEPKIFGFKVVGKRGSKFYNPPKGNIRYNFETMTGVDKERIIDEVKRKNAQNSGKQSMNTKAAAIAGPSELAELSQAFGNNLFISESKDAESVLNEHRDEKSDQPALPAMDDGGSKKKNKKKNRK